MYLLDQLLHNYDKRMYDQARNETGILSRASSKGYSLFEKTKLYAQAAGYDLSYRTERLVIGAMAVTTAIPIIALMPLAILASPSLLLKANLVSDYVRRYFKVTKHLCITTAIMLSSVPYSPTIMKTADNDLKFSWMRALEKAPEQFSGTKERLEISLREQLRKVKPLDVALLEENHQNNTAKKSQTFAEYVSSKKHNPHPDKPVLHLQLLSDFGPTQKKIAKAAADFVKHLFNCPVNPRSAESLSFDVLKADHLKLHENTGTKKGRKEYREKLHADFPKTHNATVSYNAQTTTMMLKDCIQDKINPDSPEHLLAITSAPIHEGLTPVFKKTNQKNNLILCSIEGMKHVAEEDPAKALDLTVKRVLKVVAQEVALIKGIAPCKDHECGMNPYKTLREIDSRPLIGFCAEDMAKIAYSTNTSLIELYKKIYQFLETFQDNYGIKCDFEDSKRLIQNRIYALL